MVRTLRCETERYGHYSLAGESVYDRPHQWGSKRTGPDLARVGGRYSDDWHRVHLIDPRAVVPESNMPGFPWLQDNRLDGRQVAAHMTALQRLGDPYTDEEIAAAPADVAGKTELRSEEHTSELQSLMRISYAVFCLKKKTQRPP